MVVVDAQFLLVVKQCFKVNAETQGDLRVLQKVNIDDEETLSISAAKAAMMMVTVIGGFFIRMVTPWLS